MTALTSIPVKEQPEPKEKDVPHRLFTGVFTGICPRLSRDILFI
jgi:hypothetical protein